MIQAHFSEIFARCARMQILKQIWRNSGLRANLPQTTNEPLGTARLHCLILAIRLYNKRGTRAGERRGQGAAVPSTRHEKATPARAALSGLSGASGMAAQATPARAEPSLQETLATGLAGLSGASGMAAGATFAHPRAADARVRPIFFNHIYCECE